MCYVRPHGAPDDGEADVDYLPLIKILFQIWQNYSDVLQDFRWIVSSEKISCCFFVVYPIVHYSLTALEKSKRF